MPIPLILAGLGAAAAVVGVGGHISAKETNAKAQRISQDAQALYNDAKASLDKMKNTAEQALLKLGYTKKNILDSSMKQFLWAFERVKHVQLKDSIGLNELSNFMIDEQGAVQIQKMSNIYQSAISSGAAGVATGAVMALAASGSLPIVTGTLSMAGSVLMAGEIGAAAGIAGSAFSLGAAMTPLSAIVAPVVLFTGISASLKADENLEKAKQMYAEAEKAAEEMKTSEKWCEYITKQAYEYNKLLEELNSYFLPCVALVVRVVKNKVGIFENKRIYAQDLTNDEKKLIAVTRSLAGAIKSIIDTPMLCNDGSLSREGIENYNKVQRELPKLQHEVMCVTSCNYGVKAVPVKVNSHRINSDSLGTVNAIKNMTSIVITFVLLIVFHFIISYPFALGLIVLSSVILLTVNSSGSQIFGTIRNAAFLGLGIGFGICLYSYCLNLIEIKFFIVIDILLCVAFFYLFSKAYDNPNVFFKLIVSISGCLGVFTIVLLFISFFYGWLGFPFWITIIITEILYIPCAVVIAAMQNNY